MKVSKLFRHVALGALALGLLFPLTPAQASGSSPTIPDASGDVVDIIKHTQNSFRPSTSPFPSINTRYQYACKPESLSPFTPAACNASDITSSKISSDSLLQKLTFEMTTKANIPAKGAPITAIPAPFSGINYAWYFTTTSQERPLSIGIDCTGAADKEDGQIKDDFTAGNVGVQIVYTKNADCPAAKNTASEAAGVNDDGTRGALSRQNVMIPVHPKSDGWMAFVEVGLTVGQHGTPSLSGGTLICQGGATVCIDHDISLGQYEGYSGVSTSNSLKDFDPATQGKITFSVVGNKAVMTIPWNPTGISGVDGDLLVDDSRSFPWPLAEPGKNDKITNMVAEISGLVSVGANVPPINAICPDSTDNIFNESGSPLKEAGAAEGQVNRTIANTTDDAQDAAGIGTPQDDGVYLHGNGGTDHGDCIRGITGLLTLLDWTDNGFELRIYPRNPGYLPGATSYDCRYPIGEHPGAIVLVANLTLDPVSAPGVDVGTSPYDKPYTIKVFTGSPTPQTFSGTVIPDPLPRIGPLDGVVGRDKSCGYTFWVPGIHYYDILADFPA